MSGWLRLQPSLLILSSSLGGHPVFPAELYITAYITVLTHRPTLGAAWTLRDSPHTPQIADEGLLGDSPRVGSAAFHLPAPKSVEGNVVPTSPRGLHAALT